MEIQHQAHQRRKPPCLNPSCATYGILISSGQQFGTHSIEIHLKTCKKKFEDQQSTKPISERKPLPEPNKAFEDILCKGAAKVSKQELNMVNKEALKTYTEKTMEKCNLCGRKFAEGRLVIHQKSCTVEHPAKSVEKSGADSDNETMSDQKSKISGAVSKKDMQRTSCVMPKKNWP